MKCFYEGRSLIYKMEGRLHSKIFLYNSNLNGHIKIKHPEISLKMIEDILQDPDYVFKPSRDTKDFYYEKEINKNLYRVVISRYQKSVKSVVTAYVVNEKDIFSKKHVYCVYDKCTFVDYLDIEKQLENDIDYFYEIFNVAK